MPDGYLIHRPARKERCKEVPADFSMQTAHSIYRSAPPNCQIGHVEALRRVVRVLAAQGQQIVERDPELLRGVIVQVLLDEGRSETIKAGGHRRVGGEEVPCSCGGQRDFKGLTCRFHETASARQHGKGRVPFIQVTDFRLEAKLTQQPPSPKTEDQFLFEAQLRAAPIQLAGNPSMRREVRRVIAVQQVEFHPAHLYLPGTQPYRISG